MKKNICVLVAIVFAATLCGCGSKVPDLTPEQTALISEYATHLLVKHSEITNRNLLSESELEKGIAEEAQEKERQEKADAIAQTYLNAEKEMAEEADASDGQDSQEEAQVMPSQTIAEFLEEDNFSIRYASYELCQSYPTVADDDFYMAMDATSGNQLCVLKFDVSNVSGQDSEFDMIGKKNKYVLRTADGGSIPAQATMLLDDMSSYRGSIAGNATEQMVLVFEVDDTVTQMDSAQLVIKNDSGENVVSIY